MEEEKKLKRYWCIRVPLYHFGIKVGEFTGSTLAVSPWKAWNNLMHQARKLYLSDLIADWERADLQGLEVVDISCVPEFEPEGLEKLDHRGRNMIQLDSGVWIEKEET